MQTRTLASPAADQSMQPIVDVHPDESTQTGPAVSESVRRFHYTLTLNAAEIYDDNLTLSPINRVDDFFTRISAALLLSFGDTIGRQDNFFELDYEPAVLIFADNSNFNAFQNVGHVAGQYHFSRLTIGAAEDIQSVETGDSQLRGFSGTVVNGVNVDAGGRRRINTYTTHVTAAYDLTGKTSVSSAADYSVVDYASTLTDSQRLTGNLFLNYKYGPKLTIGIGGTGGRDFVDQPNSDQTFEQANVRASYEVTGKITASGSAGVEFRQFDARSGDSVSPVFSLNAIYAPFDGTTLSIDGGRITLISAGLAGQDYASTHFQVSAQQRLFQRVTLGLTAGYQNLTYIDASAASVASRQDNYYFIQPSIDVRITHFWFAGAFFVHRENSSNFSLSSFDDSQAGIRTTLKF